METPCQSQRRGSVLAGTSIIKTKVHTILEAKSLDGGLQKTAPTDVRLAQKRATDASTSAAADTVYTEDSHPAASTCGPSDTFAPSPLVSTSLPAVDSRVPAEAAVAEAISPPSLLTGADLCNELHPAGMELAQVFSLGVSLLDPASLLDSGHAAAAETASPFSRPRSCESAWAMLDYGVTAEQGTRRTMEDQHTMLAEGIPFFGVYDGHGGTQCAEYLRDNLHTLILSHPEIKSNPEQAIVDGFVAADQEFLSKCVDEKTESGSVCAVALFVRGNLVVGNVGDCEVVLCRRGTAIPLTVPHNPRKNADEAARVVAAGGRVFHNRVGHPKFNPSVVSLAVTRAIGDAGFKLDEYTDGKRSGIIAVPDTKSIRLTSEDEFLIIGCDGLWDVMSYEEVVEFCGNRFRSGCDPKEITERLVDEALSKGTTDNVTVVFISCRPNAQHPPFNLSASATAFGGSTPHVCSATSGTAAILKTGTSPPCLDGYMS